jgi:hypothetical protein
MATDPNVDPFASIGGGVRTKEGGWIPKGMNAASAGVTEAAPPEPVAPSPLVPATSSANAIPGPQTSADVLKSPTPIGGTPVQGQPGTVTGAFQQALINQLAPAPVTADNPAIAPAIQANALAESRGTDQQRAMLAEKMAAQGLNNSGGADTAQLGLLQDSAARQGQYAGGLVNDLNKQQLAATLQSQNLVGGMLGGQDVLAQQQAALAEQKRVADLDAQLRREGLGVQSDLGQSDIALRDKLGSGNLNLGLLGLLQGGQQFGQNLGLQAGIAGQNFNQQALAQLLGQL